MLNQCVLQWVINAHSLSARVSGINGEGQLLNFSDRSSKSEKKEENIKTQKNLNVDLKLEETKMYGWNYQK